MTDPGRRVEVMADDASFIGKHDFPVSTGEGRLIGYSAVILHNFFKIIITIPLVETTVRTCASVRHVVCHRLWR